MPTRASEPLAFTPTRASVPLAFHVSPYTLKAIHDQIKWLIHRHRRPVLDWSRQKLAVTLSVRSVTAVLLTDTLQSLCCTTVQNAMVSVAVFPGHILLRCSLLDVRIDDVSASRGHYPSVLAIDRHDADPFIDTTVTVFTRTSAPEYPQYRVRVEMDVRAPVVVFRWRVVEEVTSYMLSGPIREAVAILKQAVHAKKTQQHGDAPNSLMKEVYSSALQFGKELLQDESQSGFLELPLLRLHVTNFRVVVPKSSVDEATATFELGHIDVWNDAVEMGKYVKVAEETKTEEKEKEDKQKAEAARENLKHVHFKLSNLCVFTSLAPSLEQQYLVGNANCQITAVLGDTCSVSGSISKLFIAVNERLLDFIVQTVHGNLQERSVDCDTPWSVAAFEPQTRRKRRTVRLPQRVCVDVAFDGICAEFLLSDGGYNGTDSGVTMYRQVGSQAVGTKKWVKRSSRSRMPT